MPLKLKMADVVRFDCMACRKGHSFGQIKKSSGTCRKCAKPTFSMFTEFHEGVSGNVGLVGILLDYFATDFMLKKFGIYIHAMKTKVVKETTPDVSGADALRISQLGAYEAKCAAYERMRSHKSANA